MPLYEGLNIQILSFIFISRSNECMLVSDVSTALPSILWHFNLVPTMCFVLERNCCLVAPVSFAHSLLTPQPLWTPSPSLMCDYFQRQGFRTYPYGHSFWAMGILVLWYTSLPFLPGSKHKILFQVPHPLGHFTTHLLGCHLQLNLLDVLRAPHCG